jgi:hypothetical protein
MMTTTTKEQEREEAVNPSNETDEMADNEKMDARMVVRTDSEDTDEVDEVVDVVDVMVRMGVLKVLLGVDHRRMDLDRRLQHNDSCPSYQDKRNKGRSPTLAFSRQGKEVEYLQLHHPSLQLDEMGMGGSGNQGKHHTHQHHPSRFRHPTRHPSHRPVSQNFLSLSLHHQMFYPFSFRVVSGQQVQVQDLQHHRPSYLHLRFHPRSWVSSHPFPSDP